jgi:hypothetical protein
MKFPPRSILVVVVALSPLGVTPSAQADSVELKPEIGHAEDAVVERLVQLHETAVASKDASEVKAVLEEMLAFDNPEFFAAGKDALQYRASAVDLKIVRQEAADLGLRSPKDIQELVALREGDVQVLGAGVLGNVGGEDAGPLLHKTLRNKKLRREKPRVVAALIGAMGQLGYGKALGDVEDEYRAYSDKEVMRAAIRFFGQTKCKSLDIARALANDLDPPEPSNVDAASNPPASYWAARWESWLYVRRDVAWALKEITGQYFRPADDPNPSESAQALRYIEENAKRLGLK